MKDLASAKIATLRPATKIDKPVMAGFVTETFRQSDHASETIRRAIARCDLMPGATVSESELGKRFNLKRAPTRTALERLTVHGLVRPMHRRGYQIKPITLRDVNDLYQLREIVERAAVRIAVGRVDEASLRQLDKVCSETYTPGDRDSEEGFLRANLEFHMLIAHSTGNERLTSTVRNVLNDLERIFHFTMTTRNRTEEMRHEHEALIVALSKGNAVEAERAICDELSASKAVVLDALMSSASLLDVNLTTDSPISRPSGVLGIFPA